jgi:SAM-dependent methyltransferase
MKVKQHYDTHLANFYSWMMGNFTEKTLEQRKVFESFQIYPISDLPALDLGAGNGIQSLALAGLGFSVISVDFNEQLLDELRQNKGEYSITVAEEDILTFLKNFNGKAQLVVCMGDTLTHLESIENVRQLFEEITSHLVPGGKVVLSFRDLTTELKHEQRFLPVKSDDQRILTCFLEYFPDHVMVHDILYENENGKWIQKVSAYPKLRLSEKKVIDMLADAGIQTERVETINRMVYIFGTKSNVQST